jgi:hypothetical protein
MRHTSIASLVLAPALACPLVATAETVTSAAPATPIVTPADGMMDIYFIPMRGQMGTDVHKSVYEKVLKDVKEKKPDLVVYTINCADYNTNFYLQDDDKNNASLGMIDEYRSLVKSLQEDIAEFPQVVWVEDSVGFSGLMALAWPDMYMTSSARLEGLGRVGAMGMGWKDHDIRAKMVAAITGYAKGFLEQGGYPLELGEALVRPDRMLSVSFEGRSIKWAQDSNGHWVIDGSNERTARFTAQLAEDIGLCKGIADTRDDLAFILGYREYRPIDSGEKIVDSYIEDWRRVLENTTKYALEYADAMKNAGGTDAVKYLGQAKRALEKILAGMTQYEAVETRWKITRGEDKGSIKLEIEKLQEQIRQLEKARKEANKSGSGSSGGSGPGLGGGYGGKK